MKKMILFTLLSLASSLLAETDSPALIPFQGRLTDQNGVAYSNAQYSITFNIYHEPAGGAPRWSERHEKVGIINGMINVFLGSITPLPGNVNFSKTVYLGITIDSDGNNNTPDPEMVPRQLIVMPFYAKNADKLRGADWSAIMVAGEADDPMTGHISGAKLADKSVTRNKLADGILDNGIPAGVIMPFAGPKDNIPDGWWLCAGQVLSKAEHPALYAAIGNSWPNVNNIQPFDPATQFCLPDFTRRTLWGADDSADGNVGQYKEAALPNLRFQYSAFLSGPWGVGAGTSGWVGGPYTKTTYASELNSICKDGNTVQPPAGCVNFIIKD